MQLVKGGGDNNQFCKSASPIYLLRLTFITYCILRFWICHIQYILPPACKVPWSKVCCHFKRKSKSWLIPPLSDKDLSQIFYARTVVTGTSVKAMKALHEKYGLFPKSSPSCK